MLEMLCQNVTIVLIFICKVDMQLDAMYNFVSLRIPLIINLHNVAKKRAENRA